MYELWGDDMSNEGARAKAEHYALHDVSSYICPACGEECWEMSARDYLAGYQQAIADALAATHPSAGGELLEAVRVSVRELGEKS